MASENTIALWRSIVNGEGCNQIHTNGSVNNYVLVATSLRKSLFVTMLAGHSKFHSPSSQCRVGQIQRQTRRKSVVGVHTGHPLKPFQIGVLAEGHNSAHTSSHKITTINAAGVMKWTIIHRRKRRGQHRPTVRGLLCRSAGSVLVGEDTKLVASNVATGSRALQRCQTVLACQEGGAPWLVGV